MLGFSPLSAFALGEIPSTEAADSNLTIAFASISTLQGSLSQNLNCSIDSTSSLSAELSVGVLLSTTLNSMSTLTVTISGTSTIGIGDKVNITRLKDSVTITLM